MTTNRRGFIKKYGIATAGIISVPAIIPACSRGKNGAVAPSDRINMAFLGAGNQAGNDVREFLKDERLQITTVCDVNKESTGYWSGKVAGRDFIKRQVDDFYSEKNGKKSDLRNVYDFVQNKDPKAHKAQFLLANIYLKEGNKEAALNSISLALATKPGKSDYLNILLLVQLESI